MLILIFLFAIVITYIIGVVVVYNRTNNLMNKLELLPSPEEAGMLLRLIVLYPIFYPEIEQFLRTLDKNK
ncbi:hypothetical protein UFOVP53_141 [uncultured Caudovirales phage]|uniref:Uncharacterized protein n=1 Tax=uncultured Caudovirales phage TaxID=2100421 RepID=A0A6J5KZA5_9CAUD|nr:hypothetical protein UFOVP53_141 [uncultured Caudovirales phage]